MSDAARRSLCEAVDGPILMGHMQELARWVKLSGTPDELQSLRYFQAKLDEYGYRTRLIMHDAYISLPGKARVDVESAVGNVNSIQREHENLSRIVISLGALFWWMGRLLSLTSNRTLGAALVVGPGAVVGTLPVAAWAPVSAGLGGLLLMASALHGLTTVRRMTSPKPR